MAKIISSDLFVVQLNTYVCETAEKGSALNLSITTVSVSAVEPKRLKYANTALNWMFVAAHFLRKSTNSLILSKQVPQIFVVNLSFLSTCE